jgi:Skp family chaperone for outer membrane proteins
MATTAAARVTASTIGYVVPAVAGVATNVATSALTGLGRSMGFFKTAEEKAAEAERKRIAEEKRKAVTEAAKKVKELEKLQKQLEEQKRKEEEAKRKPKQRTPSPPKPAEDDPLAQSRAKLEELKRAQEVRDIDIERLLKRTEFPSFTRKELKDMPQDVLNSYLYRSQSGAYLSADAYEAKYGVNENYRKIWEEKERRTRQRYESQLKPEPTTVAEVLAAKLTTPKSPSPPKSLPLPTGVDLTAGDFKEMSSTQIREQIDKYERYLKSRTPEGKIAIAPGAPWYDRDYKDVHNAWQRAQTGLAKAKKEGRGIGKKIPKSRKVTVSQEDKMKNRLRLVVSQIQAGNTNPKLIIEVNKLYKKLYNIPNAYSLIKK